MYLYVMKFLRCLLLSLLSVLTANATTYDIGPGYALTNLRDAPWATLNPGDIVNVHSKPGGYHDMIQVSRSGTAAQHIVIHGVPDPVTGALPILDGNGAVEDPTTDWRNAIFSQISVIVVSPRAASYHYGVDHVSFIDIENLDIRNVLYTANSSITYTDKFGVTHPWDGFGCGIYIEWAHDLAVRGCEISNCCNGLFANSKNGSAQSSARLLIEHNYFHDNSMPYTVDPANASHIISNGYAQHHCYIESAGVTYQYNRFGQLRPNCYGVAIKDRSAGQIIRYNEFDMVGQSNVMALIDPQGGNGYLNTLPDFRDSYVYGNLITIESYASSMDMIWWGAYNGPADYAAEHRNVLHFYNNTIVNHHSGVSLFFLPSTNYMPAGAVVQETVDCRNNIFFTDTTVQSSSYQAMRFSIGGATNGGGNIILSKNWVSPGWRTTAPGATWGGTLVGTNNLLVGDSVGANNPHFVNMATRDYHVLTGSNVLDASGSLGAGDPPVLEEYSAPQSSIARTVIGSALDLGAVESTGNPPLPPVGGAIALGAATYSVVENAGSVSATITRTGGSTGSVSIVCASTSGTATSPADFTAAVTTFTWAAGDTTPRTFTVPIINDTATELAETLSVTLSNITGGAGYGPITQSTITISDDDVPPTQPIVAITASGALIRFTSGAPGTILSNVAVTGITSPETMRGLAFRRSTGQLYVVGAVGGTSNVAATLYLLNPATAVLTSIATMTLAHPSFDLGFDATTDQLHLFGSTGQHLRIHPTTGAIIATDTALAYAAGDPHFGATPGIVGADFTPGLSPTVYAIDKTLDTLVRIGTPGSASSGQITTIGLLGKDTEGLTGLDFTPGGTAFAVLTSTADTSSNLYVIDTTTGQAASLGTIGVAEQIRDLVVATPGQISLTSTAFSATEGDGTANISIVRTGGSWGPVSVTFSTSNGTATAGSDYTAVTTTVTWLDGEVGVKNVSIPILDDTLIEGNETLTLTLATATGGALLIAPTTGTLTLHERPFDAWKLAAFGAAANFPYADANADPDGDGLSNLLEYALGTNPLTASPAALPIISTANNHLTLSFTRSAADILYAVEVTSDLLQPWTLGSSYGPTGDTPSTAATSELSRTILGGLELITIGDNTTIATQPSHFIRLRVTLQ